MNNRNKRFCLPYKIPDTLDCKTGGCWRDANNSRENVREALINIFKSICQKPWYYQEIKAGNFMEKKT
jgi:hypothetical protein